MRSSKPIGIGKVLREARESQGMSLRNLAKLAKCSPTYVSLIENDPKVHVSDSFVERVSAALSLDRDNAFLAAGKVPPDVCEFLLKNPPAIKKVRAMMERQAS